MKSEKGIKIRIENSSMPLFVETEEIIDEMKNIPEIIANYANEFFFEKYTNAVSSERGRSIPIC